MLYSFVFFLILFTVIGALTSLKSKNNNEDYLLASRNIKPSIAALSAVATNNSGYMFIGMIGFTYEFGLSSMWLMIGWIFGDFVASFVVHQKIRIISEKNNILSFSGLISNWGNKNYKILRCYLGLITIIFLGTYAAAQLSAGSKALNVLLGWNYNLGAIIGSIIVVIYCFSGGIRASIVTDVAQSLVMIGAMALLCFVSLSEIGGFEQLHFKMNNISEEFSSVMIPNSSGSILSLILFIVGWFVAGFGVIGQPHIMIRFMSVDNSNNIAKMRIYYYLFFTIFWAMTILVGLMARILIPDINNFDAELALPILSNNLLPQILVGVILAGLFAANISTADSQILSCSAALSRDFSQKDPSYFFTKLSTIIVTIFALLIALLSSKNVFDLVLISWSALSVSFMPLLLLKVFNKNISQIAAILASIVGIFVIIIWRHLGLNNNIYEIVPALVATMIVIVIDGTINKFLAHMRKKPKPVF